ncbi:MAG TPA: radical SAM protein, partial [Acidimicrobiales bacterium]|nr:radical SAM protein [Acidimicrobiales bacterium]
MTAVPVVLESRPDGVPPESAAAAVLAFGDAHVPRLLAKAHRATPADVDRALAGSRPTLDDLAALLSPAASARLEELAAAAHRLTVRRFGRVVRLFAPLYLSNECASTCTYCGFSAGNDIARRTLSPEDAAAEARALRERGFRHVLLVSGEQARIVSKDYLEQCVAAVAAEVPSVSVEVQVWDTTTYRRLVGAGCEGLLVYQETYDRETYAATHLKGKKRNYEWRLAAPDRGAAAGMRHLGVGALLGLHDDWRADVLTV